eukprot:scaffold800_cov111-Isochrysis_galbana.AAC.1
MLVLPAASRASPQAYQLSSPRTSAEAPPQGPAAPAASASQHTLQPRRMPASSPSAPSPSTSVSVSPSVESPRAQLARSLSDRPPSLIAAGSLALIAGGGDVALRPVALSLPVGLPSPLTPDPLPVVWYGPAWLERVAAPAPLSAVPQSASAARVFEALPQRANTLPLHNLLPLLALLVHIQNPACGRTRQHRPCRGEQQAPERGAQPVVPWVAGAPIKQLTHTCGCLLVHVPRLEAARQQPRRRQPPSAGLQGP